MMFRSKNDSMARYDAEQDDDRERRRQDPEPDDDGQRRDEQADAERRPGLAERPSLRVTDGGSGSDGVVEVDARIVEVAGPQRREPVAPGADDRRRARPPACAGCRQPRLALAELGGRRDR